ncbi:metallophosphoesterase [Clostridium sp. AF32-12BH]|mgnify:FL=1|uniref:metallophosphoesterase n=1 Tax=Clostridium sp. AF32-12BH TaxID=2292006 RepID=UPI000E51768F|nr:metallophosphoesterase [Clostridium sp. AF32-12BH]RHP47223.1 metallophosphatase [Clostridium sp. AF32-12BH]
MEIREIMSIYITGDTHGNFERFLDPRFVKSMDVDKCDYMIVTGDFGGLFYGTQAEDALLDFLEDYVPFTLLFVDGNHENFDLLKNYPVETWHQGKVHFIRPHIIHLMRGNCYMIENRTFFVMGGARSVDVTDGIFELDDSRRLEKIAKLEAEGKYWYRTKGLDWFEEELPSDDELQAGLEVLKSHENRVDYILTHAAPSMVAQYFSAGKFDKDKLTEYFEKLRKQVEFRTWYCGHYHVDEEFILEGKAYQILYHQIVKIC